MNDATISGDGLGNILKRRSKLRQAEVEAVVWLPAAQGTLLSVEVDRGFQIGIRKRAVLQTHNDDRERVCANGKDATGELVSEARRLFCSKVVVACSVLICLQP